MSVESHLLVSARRDAAITALSCQALSTTGASEQCRILSGIKDISAHLHLNNGPQEWLDGWLYGATGGNETGLACMIEAKNKSESTTKQWKQISDL